MNLTLLLQARTRRTQQFKIYPDKLQKTCTSCSVNLGCLLTPIRLNGFLPFASDFGFFLNIPRFQASMLQPFPLGHHSCPSPALIFSTHLFAIRLSSDPLVKPNESAYLTRATQEATTALSGNHPHKIMHSIQAEVLLATYFFSNGRFFEGKYHVANAVSTAISTGTGLHKLRSSSPVSPQRSLYNVMWLRKAKELSAHGLSSISTNLRPSHLTTTPILNNQLMHLWLKSILHGHLIWTSLNK